MAKKVIRLNENELKTVIRESVNRVLNEMEKMNEGPLWNAMKYVHNDNKNKSQEDVKRELRDIASNRDDQVTNFIKGNPNKQDYFLHKFNRKNNLKPGVRQQYKHIQPNEGDIAMDELNTQPGLAGYAKRAGLAGFGAADTAYRYAMNKIRGKK